MDKKITELHSLIGSCSIVDLSPTLEKGIPRCPAHPPLIIDQTATHAHDGYYSQTISMAEHTGAHVDAPAHQMPDMMDATIETFPVNVLMGPAIVYNLHEFDPKPGARVSEEQILKLEKKMGTSASEGDIVLLNFNWFQHWTTTSQWRYYAENEPGLSAEAVKLFCDRKVRAVGSDTIACDTPAVEGAEGKSYGHRVYWLPNNILIMEMLMNLGKLPVWSYFIALPLKIKNGSGSPIRPIALF